MVRLKPGEKVATLDGGAEYTVDALIHSGSGQGDIYKVHRGKDVYAMKLFHSGDPKKHLKQIERLQIRGRASSVFVHPIETVQVGELVGYTMEYVGGEHYKNGAILCNGVEKDLGDGMVAQVELPFHQKISILYRFLEAVRILFDANIIIGDYKFENLKINMNDLSVKILDTDTAVGGKDRPVVCGTVGFMEPRVMRGEIAPDVYSDAYSVAVMIWMTLVGGHPLKGRRYEEPCNGNIDTYTFATDPVYVYDRKNTSNRPLDGDTRIIDRMKKYPTYFADAMHRTFSDGLFDGKKRVTPREWMEILNKLYDEHYLCRTCGEEHFFSSTVSNCGVCGSKLTPPIRLCCEESGLDGVRLFNGCEVRSEDLLGDETGYPLFRVVVSDYDKKYGLMCIGPHTVKLEMKNGQSRDFERGEVIPIFMDSTLTLGKHKLRFFGNGRKKNA